MIGAKTNLRCAIYTRKSSDEGLEQSFNSLHAQREACEAYIKSQAHEGWTCLGQPYDDGGFSGGSMERPGLTALLGDLDRGLIDVVVVYKVDRLTRSLADFARIVETFDRRNVSFVSVTQAFNTTTSMGRLTLNVLLSFAQFEREVTGERIRDKIAASKKKGMWMGGNLPLGYDRSGDTLQINAAEAEQVRAMFARYLELGSVDVLQQAVTQLGYRSKSRVSRKGDAIGGAVFTRGALYHLLTNAHYLGLIRHKDQLYAGLHPAIIEQGLFDAVQTRLAAQSVNRGGRKHRAASARLTGRIFLDDGTPLTPSFSYGRGGRPYGYYIAVGGSGTGGMRQAPRRIPTAPLESFLLDTLIRLSGRPDSDWSDLDPILLRLEVRTEEADLVLDAKRLFTADHPELALAALRARLAPNEQVVREAGDRTRLRIRVARRLSFRGGHSWLEGAVHADAHRPTRPNPALIAGLKAAHAALRQQGIDPIAGKFDRDARSPIHPYQRRLCLLAFLAPELQRAVVEGNLPQTVTLHGLVAGDPPPLLWREQSAWLTERRRSV